MKNRDLMRYPNPQELYALERAAHAARAEEVARLVRLAFDFVVKGAKHA